MRTVRVASFMVVLTTLAVPTGGLSATHSDRPAAADPLPPFRTAHQSLVARQEALGRLLPVVDAAQVAPAPSPLAADERPTPARPAQADPLPSAAATTIVVRQGQTLWDLARSHGLTVEQIVEANALENPHRVRAGQRLRIPAAASTPRAQSRGPGLRSAATASIALGFLWPTRGSLTSRFGWRWSRHHDGIDIAAPYGTPIRAAKPGRVIHAGWYSGYGRTLIIDHGGGVSSLYGHASQLLATDGQLVDAGQDIARVGSTGNARGPHLHFEIRLNSLPIDPLLTLTTQRLRQTTPPPSAIRAASAGTAQRGRYHVQVGAYRLAENAAAQLTEMRRSGFAASITRSEHLYLVRVGSFADRRAADQVVADLRGRGVDAFVTR